MKKVRYVEVLWLDAHQTTYQSKAESELDEFHKPMETFSVGVVVRNNEDGISIAGCRDYHEIDDPDYDRVLFIPRGMIKKVRYLK